VTRTQQRRMQMSRQILNRTRRHRPVLEARPSTRAIDETPRAFTDHERDELLAHDVDRLRRTPHDH
jgi:hypothetical protein